MSGTGCDFILALGVDPVFARSRRFRVHSYEVVALGGTLDLSL